MQRGQSVLMFGASFTAFALGAILAVILARGNSGNDSDRRSPVLLTDSESRAGVSKHFERAATEFLAGFQGTADHLRLEMAKYELAAIAAWTEDESTAKQVIDRLPEQERLQAVGAIVGYLAKADPKDALVAMQALEGDHFALKKRLVSKWATSRPEEATRWILANERSQSFQAHLLRSVVGTWALDNVDAPLEWIGGNVASARLRGSLVNAVFSTAARSSTDLEVVARSALQLPASRSGVAALKSVLRRWIEVDKVEAIRFVEALPFEKHSVVVNDLVRGLYSSDPSTAMDLIERIPNKGGRIQLTAQYVKHRLARNGHADTARWVAGLPESYPMRHVAIAEWAKEAASASPEAALSNISFFSEIDRRRLRTIIAELGDLDEPRGDTD